MVKEIYHKITLKTVLKLKIEAAECVDENFQMLFIVFIILIYSYLCVDYQELHAA